MSRVSRRRHERRRRGRSNADAYYARIGQAFVELLAERNADGYVYRVDLRLRPFGTSGRDGALVRGDGTVLPARRPRLGTLRVDQGARGRRAIANAGARLLDTLRPFVFRRYLDYTAFAGLREMKALIDAEVARKDLSQT